VASTNMGSARLAGVAGGARARLPQSTRAWCAASQERHQRACRVVRGARREDQRPGDAGASSSRRSAGPDRPGLSGSGLLFCEEDSAQCEVIAVEDPQRSRPAATRRRAAPPRHGAPSAPSAATSRRCRTGSRSRQRAEGGRKVWRLIEGYRQRLTQTFTLSELAALYFGKEPDVVPGRAPSRATGVGLRQDRRDAAAQPAVPVAHQELFSARPSPGRLLEEEGRDRRADRRDRCTSARLLEYYSFHSRRTRSNIAGPLSVVLSHAGSTLREGGEYAECARSPWSGSRASR